MANLKIGGMKTLAQSLDVPDSTNEVLLAIWTQVDALKPRIPADTVVLKPRVETSRVYDTKDLPLTAYDAAGNPNARAKYIVDMILDCECVLSENTVFEKARNGEYDDMPEPLNPKNVLPGVVYYVQIFAYEKSPGVWDMVKHYMFEEPHKLSIFASQIAHGTTCVINWWRSNTFATKKILQKALEGLGGFQILWCVWDPKRTDGDNKHSKDTSMLLAGFAHIQKEQQRLK